MGELIFDYVRIKLLASGAANHANEIKNAIQWVRTMKWILSLPDCEERDHTISMCNTQLREQLIYTGSRKEIEHAYRDIITMVCDHFPTTELPAYWYTRESIFVRDATPHNIKSLEEKIIAKYPHVTMKLVITSK